MHIYNSQKIGWGIKKKLGFAKTELLTVGYETIDIHLDDDIEEQNHIITCSSYLINMALAFQKLKLQLQCHCWEDQCLPPSRAQNTSLDGKTCAVILCRFILHLQKQKLIFALRSVITFSKSKHITTALGQIHFSLFLVYLHCVECFYILTLNYEYSLFFLIFILLTYITSVRLWFQEI